MTAALPSPRPLPTAPSLRWGVLAPGHIAHRAVAATHQYSAQRFVAVGSRSRERAERFAGTHGLERAYGSYRALVEDPTVDVVYIASPHSSHAELALLAIGAGKHILVEKPFAATGPEAQSIAAAAQNAGVFAMEAMWTRYLPQADVIRQLLEARAVGDVQMVTADFGFGARFDPSSRLFDPNQAGGALLDAGIYPLSFASSILGAPSLLTAAGTIAPTGVESDAMLLLDHPRGKSSISTSITASMPVRATILGNEGRIEVHSPFIGANGVTLVTESQNSAAASWEGRRYPDLHDALHYQMDALARFVAADLKESPVHSLEETVAIVSVIDDASSQIRCGAATRSAPALTRR
ncbi:Gfo/Idh/MocA family protein [Pseudarthrobacter sp. DSP2-3-2b1]|uniref:Gfo/Idh/MocA family protein n=1 Tax=Pseudarthrobacter sp. DSP2-3-2b1 TaxID=2804661 RepID=UPI003CFA7CF5